MSNIIITAGYDYTVSTSTGQTADMPVNYLNKTQIADLFQSSTANSSLVIDLGTAKAVNVIAALFTNLPADATWQIRGAESQAAVATGTILYNGSFRMNGLALHDGRSHGLYYREAAHSYRFYQIIISGASVAGGKVQIGRLLIGKSFTPEYNYDWGAAHKINDRTSFIETASGALIPRTAPAASNFQCSLSYLTEDEAYGDYYLLRNKAAQAEAMLIIPDIDHPQLMRDIAYGFMAADAPTYQSKNREYSTILKITGLA